ncbi:hypothetical protein ElyMa_005584800 [Elysia marginata]|uniref:Uncharacterized protein n=1 Tax=Elysia marginata TaxID=1093978 RepID=A0AAV4F3B1_9GAST|nr:hypothetical protein ElyMa_005584800 [Elysia marginata]
MSCPVKIPKHSIPSLKLLEASGTVCYGMNNLSLPWYLRLFPLARPAGVENHCNGLDLCLNLSPQHFHQQGIKWYTSCFWRALPRRFDHNTDHCTCPIRTMGPHARRELSREALWQVVNRSDSDQR